MTLTPISVMIVNVKDGDWKFIICGLLIEALEKSCGNGYVINETVSTREGGSRVVTRGTAGWLA